MGSESKSEEVNDALKQIQTERQSAVVDINHYVNHEEIESSLSDDEVVEVVEVVDDPVNKKPKKVKVPKAEKTSKKINYKLLMAFGAFAVLGAAYYFSTADEYSEIRSASLPSFSSWSLFSDASSDVVNDPIVTRSYLESVLQKQREFFSEEISSLSSVGMIKELRGEISYIQTVQNNQQKVIESIIQKASTQQSVNTIEYEAQLLSLRGELNSLNSFTGELLSKMAKLDESAAKIDESNKKIVELVNSNWVNHLRIKKLEDNTINGVVEKQPVREIVTDMKRPQVITWNNEHAWVLKIASDRFTQVYNKNSGKHMRVFVGVEIPSCGLVLSIDIPARKISTQHCSILRG